MTQRSRFQIKHGAATGNKTRTYRKWNAMMGRCYVKSATGFDQYGGAGVVVCDRWHDFANFLADMGEAPAGMSLDRWPVSNGNYEPGNCRWATRQEQNDNRRSVIWLEVDGERLTAAGWARKVGTSKANVYRRLKAGWTIRQALGFDSPPAIAPYARSAEIRQRNSVAAHAWREARRSA